MSSSNDLRDCDALQLWDGERFTELRVVHKAYALVLRGEDLLVFEHPEPAAGLQVPKGSFHSAEGPETAALRELHEEAGLDQVRTLAQWPTLRMVVRGGLQADGPYEEQRWHRFVFVPQVELPDAWDHVVGGDGFDRGMCFRYRWYPLAEAARLVHPYFAPVLRR